MSDVFHPVSEFPKLMWSPDGVEVTVRSPDEQSAKEADGYRLTADVPAESSVEAPADAPAAEVPPPDPENESPTFGAADDDMHGDDDQTEDGKSKKGSKKK